MGKEGGGEGGSGGRRGKRWELRKKGQNLMLDVMVSSGVASFDLWY